MRHKDLSPRQTEVLELYYHGKSHSEIQQILGINSSSVERLLAAVQNKLGVEHRHGAIYAGLREGVLKVPEKK